MDAEVAIPSPRRVEFNAVVCPWPLQGEKRGCTLPGTDNHEADTAHNQAGLISEETTTRRPHRSKRRTSGMLNEIMSHFFASTGRTSVNALLYLNKHTFKDDGATAAFVAAAMDKKINMVLVQELDSTKGACTTVAVSVSVRSPVQLVCW